MEIYELRYFLVAAELENVNKAALKLSISAPAVSRAIARLEEELGVQLFERIGRNIVLSANGKHLQREVSRLVGSLDEIKLKFKPRHFDHSIAITGTEFGLSTYISSTIKKIKLSKAPFSAEIKVGQSSKEVERAVLDGESHLGIIARDPGSHFQKVRLGILKSRVYVGENHEIYKFAKIGKEVPVENVLKFEFVGFLNKDIFEQASAVSADGWRDDKFPRKLGLKAESIEAALRSIEDGLYLSYLPEAIATNRAMLPLKISGCPYKCETEIFLLARKDLDLSWMRFLF